MKGIGNTVALTFVVVEGPLKGSRIPLPASSTIVVGRSPECELAVEDRSLSRRHFQVTARDTGEVLLEDLASHNQTFVNGEAVNASKALRPGDEIRAGKSLFVLSPPDGEPEFAAGETAEVRLADSLYWSQKSNVPSGERSTRDLKTLVRLSAMIHSFVAGESTREGLAARLLDLLRETFPADRGAVLIYANGADRDPSSIAAHPENWAGFSRTVLRSVIARQTGVRVGPASMSESLASHAVTSVIAAPVVARGEVAAVVYLSGSDVRRFLDDQHLELLVATAGLASVAWENVQYIEWLEREKERLNEELGLRHDLIGEGPRMVELKRLIAKAAPSASTVLIMGESGTGKELLARAVHRNSPRANKPFMAINCAALTESLLESELFGYEKGAFTGANAQKKGKLETAEGGTVFLDEIGELAIPMQAKLLRVLQEREFDRVGGTRPIKLDVRLVAATNRDLEQEVKAGRFRQDLFYRLNVVVLRTAPLRERTEDILPLAQHFARKYASLCGRKITGFTAKARAYLQQYGWPGNVRELENAIERAVVLGSEHQILAEDLPEQLRESARPAEVAVTIYDEAVEQAKRQVILRAFEQAAYDHEAAARMLGLHPNYLHRLIRALDLRAVLKRAAANARAT
jgi:Nif-specific regulatory protein